MPAEASTRITLLLKSIYMVFPPSYTYAVSMRFFERSTSLASVSRLACRGERPFGRGSFVGRVHVSMETRDSKRSTGAGTPVWAARAEKHPRGVLTPRCRGAGLVARWEGAIPHLPSPGTACSLCRRLGQAAGRRRSVGGVVHAPVLDKDLGLEQGVEALPGLMLPVELVGRPHRA